MKRKYLNYLKWFLGFLILSLLLHKIGFTQIYQTLGTINMVYILVILLGFFATFVLGTLNLKLLVNTLNHRIPFWRLFKYYSLAWSLGLFVPGKMGEFSLVSFLGREEISIGQGTAIAIVDKSITFITLSLLSIFGFFIFFTKMQSIRLIGILLLGALIGYFFLLSTKGRNLIKRYVLKRYAARFSGFSKTVFYYLRHHKHILFINFVLTTLKWTISALVVYLLISSFDQLISFTNVFLITAITIIVSLIPITISGLGIKESIAVFLYYKVGISSSIIASIYLVLLCFSYSISIVIILLFLKKLLLFPNTQFNV